MDASFDKSHIEWKYVNLSKIVNSVHARCDFLKKNAIFCVAKTIKKGRLWVTYLGSFSKYSYPGLMEHITVRGHGVATMYRILQCCHHAFDMLRQRFLLAYITICVYIQVIRMRCASDRYYFVQDVLTKEYLVTTRSFCCLCKWRHVFAS